MLTGDEAVANSIYLNLDKSVKTLFAHQATCAKENNNKQTIDIKSLMRTNIKAVNLVEWQKQDTLNLFDLLDN